MHHIDTEFSVSKDGEDYYKLQLAITQMDPGSAVGRMIVGELGAGHAKIQVEGRLENNAGDIIMAFSDLRSNSGAIGLKDLGGDAGPQLVKDSLGELAEAIMAELKSNME